MRDPYKILGVKRDAGADEIKAAWRSLAKSVHPDHNQEDPNATERFTEIGRAYETLKDPKKRSRFDHLSQTAEAKRGGETIMQQRQAAREAAERAKAARANAEKVMEELARAKAQRAAEATAETAAAPETGSTAPKGAGKSGPTAANPSTGAGESAEAMIERIFGAKAGAASSASEPAAAAAAPGASAGSAASSASPASATSAAASAEKRQEAPKSEAATSEEVTDEQEQVLAAGGIGALVGRPPLAILSSLVRRLTGAAPALEKAPDIAAEASVTVDDILKGQWIAVTLSDGREVRFQAAPGIGDGQVVRLKGQGLKLQGMQRGDVAITVHLHEQGQFAIKGLDVHTVLPVTIENAVLGCTATVEGPNGPVTVTVPAWSGSDHLIRVAGGGLSGPGEASGDLVVELRLMLWEKPDDKVTDLMRSMKNGLYL